MNKLFVLMLFTGIAMLMHHQAFAQTSTASTSQEGQKAILESKLPGLERAMQVKAQQTGVPLAVLKQQYQERLEAYQRQHGELPSVSPSPKMPVKKSETAASLPKVYAKPTLPPAKQDKPTTSNHK